MTRFLLNTDVLGDTSKNIYKYSQELVDLVETVSSYSIDTDKFDFSGAKNKIAENLNKMSVRISNISQVIGYEVDCHKAIQRALECNASDNLNIKSSNTNTSSGNTKSNSKSSHSSTPTYYSSSVSKPSTTMTGYATPSDQTTNYEPSTPSTSVINKPVVSIPQEEKNNFVNYFQKNYQNEYGQGSTIAAKGAAPTAIAMVLTALKGKEITPVETAQWSIDSGYANSESTSEITYFDAIAEAYDINCEQLELTQENILTNIKDGKYMIVSMKEGQFGETENYVVITGITEDGKITIADPNSEDNSTKTWDLSVFLDEGAKLWVF